MALTLHESFERCCRLCAEEQEVTIMIFSAEAEAMLLQNKLNKYLLIEVDEEDKLPKNICIRCCSKLQTVCEFIDTARKAQEVLLNQSIILDQFDPPSSQNCMVQPITEIKSEVEYSDDENHITEMEISVDPMMILQNSDSLLSPNVEESTEDKCNDQEEDITHLHSVDGENVTIKLIKKGDAPTDQSGPGLKKKKIKPFPCITCKRSFYTELALKNHSWIHFNEERVNKKFKCGTCEESFDYKCDLIVHLKKHRTNGMCTICGRCFRTDRTLAAHMTVHMASSKAYTCKVCGRSYNTRSNLKTHSITHSSERPYHCHLCKKSFKRNQDLKFHINQHTGAKPYKCPFCDKSFASSGNCYSHRSRMHPGRRVDAKVRRRMAASLETGAGRAAALHPRPIAPKPAPAPAQLTSVKGIFKYQCSLCNHSFMRRDNYTYHMYQHTGEKPFQCTFCQGTFVTRTGLLLHHDKEHPDSDRPLALLSKNVLLK
ncbi:zinc finger protein 691-like [Cydia amplana]|uniref:zinc finger protein 691-like n=1 Tax=Cydia amplana TaxID=1869771 RepID=UPI002FE62667